MERGKAQAQPPAAFTEGATPYLAARREWDERYGDALARAANWRRAAFAALGLAALAVLGVVYVGAQSKIKPFVVELNALGDPIALAQPVTGGAVAQRITEAQVANWVWNAKTVLPDPNAQKVLIKSVYAMLSNAAAGYLNDWYQKHPPFGASVITDVAITAVLPVAAQTYQVDWSETSYQNGRPLGPAQQWKANITVTQDRAQARSPQALIANPLGIFITNVTWTQIV